MIVINEKIGFKFRITSEALFYQPLQKNPQREKQLIKKGNKETANQII